MIFVEKWREKTEKLQETQNLGRKTTREAIRSNTKNETEIKMERQGIERIIQSIKKLGRNFNFSVQFFNQTPLPHILVPS